MPSTQNPAPAPATPTAEERFAAALETIAQSNAAAAQSNAALLANQPRPRLTYGDLLAKRPKRVMPFHVFQNGFRLTVDKLTDEQLALLPKLKVGRFNNRMIHVYRDATPDRAWHIDYANKAPEQRMAFGKYAGRDFTEFLQRLTTETPDLE